MIPNMLWTILLSWYKNNCKYCRQLFLAKKTNPLYVNYCVDVKDHINTDSAYVTVTLLLTSWKHYYFPYNSIHYT